MKTEPRPTLIDFRPSQAPLHIAAARAQVVASAVEHLSLAGYAIDPEKIRRIEEARLIGSIRVKAAERAVINRLRRILDVERRLAPPAGIDALCFHLVANGVDDVPAGPIAHWIAGCVLRMFAIGDELCSAGLPTATAGPDGEARLARWLATRALASLRIGGRAEAEGIHCLASAAFLAYVRSSCTHARPARVLHRSSRLVHLDAEHERTKRLRAADPLPPVADRDLLLRRLEDFGADPHAVVAAVRNTAALVRLTVRRFPELQVPWHEAAATVTSASMPALRTLVFIPPLLAAAYLQAGRSAGDQCAQGNVAALMHCWGIG